MTEVPIELQIILWGLWDDAPLPKDYLQVFELSEVGGTQKVIHKTEQPEYSREYIFKIPERYSGKIFIIDDGENITMLLSAEY